MTTTIDPTADVFADPTPVSERAPHVRNGRYRLYDPEAGKMNTWSRVSTFAKAISDQAGLMDWMGRMVAKGVGLRTDLQALACATPLEDKATLRRVAEQAKEAAQASAGANKGTAMHSFCEAADRGESTAHAPAEWQRDIDGYRKALADCGLTVVPELVERYVIIPAFQLCGRLDRVYRTKDGRLVIGDLKTTVNIDYTWDQIGIQLGLYANAAYYWDDERDAWVPMPELDKRVGVVAHVLVGAGRTEIRPVNIEAGYAGASLAKQVREYRSKAKTMVLPLDVLGSSQAELFAARLREAQSPAVLSQVWREASALGCWTAELEQIGKQRLAELRP